jgi:hypothetical protein
MNWRKEKNKLELVVEQEVEQLDEFGLHDYNSEQDYKHLTGHHIVLYGAVGYPIVK